MYWSRVESEEIRNEITSKVANWGPAFNLRWISLKDIALDAFLDFHGLSSKEAAFIGDHYADIPLLQRVGLAVAVENALPEVKAVCDYLTCSNIDDGAASEIEEVFFAKR